MSRFSDIFSMAIIRVEYMERTRTTSLIQSSRTNALSTRKKRRETNKTSEWRSCVSVLTPSGPPELKASSAGPLRWAVVEVILRALGNSFMSQMRLS
jgi:hypothetical protein